LSSDGFSYIEKPEKRKYDKYFSFRCPCPVCRQLERPEDLWEKETTSGRLMTLHNLFWITNYTEFINTLVYYEDEFRSFVRFLNHGSKPAENPYLPPKNIEKYIAGIAAEMGDEYDINDFNLPILDGIPLTAPVFSNAEYLKEIENMSKINGKNYVLTYMDFLDNVYENGLEDAWQTHFVKFKSNASIEFTPSNTEEENENLRKRFSEENYKLQETINRANIKTQKTYREKLKQKIRDKRTLEETTVGKLVDDALSEV
jgi:hypothetical protein